MSTFWSLSLLRSITLFYVPRRKIEAAKVTFKLSCSYNQGEFLAPMHVNLFWDLNFTTVIHLDIKISWNFAAKAKNNRANSAYLIWFWRPVFFFQNEVLNKGKNARKIRAKNRRGTEQEKMEYSGTFLKYQL